MAELVVALGAQDSEQIVVSPQRLQCDHRRIFGDLFPEARGAYAGNTGASGRLARSE